MNEPTVQVSYDQKVLEARLGLIDGRWRAADRILKSEQDFNARDSALRAMAEWHGRPEWLQQWLDKKGKSPVPWLLSAVHAVNWAWQPGPHEMPEDEVFKLVAQRLELAVEHLTRAAELDPADPAPWAWRIMCFLGLGREQNLVRQAYREAVSRHLDNWTAHSFMMTGLTRRWGGSHERMFKFARMTASDAPDGSPLHSLIAEAHIEKFLWEREQDPDHANEELRAAEAGDEIEASLARRFRGLDISTTTAVDDLNRYAFLLWHGGRPEAAREQIEAINGRVMKHPWHFVGDPTEQYLQAHRTCCPDDVTAHPPSVAPKPRRSHSSLQTAVRGFKILRNDELAELVLMVGITPWALWSVPHLAQTLNSIGIPMPVEALSVLRLPAHPPTLDPWIMAGLAALSALFLLWARTRLVSVRRLLQFGDPTYGRLAKVDLQGIKGWVEYEYSFNGSLHRSKQAVWRTPLTKRFKPGSEVMLMVHPRRPSRALIRGLYLARPRRRG